MGRIILLPTDSPIAISTREWPPIQSSPNGLGIARLRSRKGNSLNVQFGARQVLIHGLALILVGLLWGLVVPHTPFPRLALGAHLQFEFNGIFLMVLATAVLKLDHAMGPWSTRIFVLSAWLMWPMALSEAANAWWGTNKMLPIAAIQAGATGAAPWQEGLLQITHISAGLAAIVAVFSILIGFLRRSSSVT